MSVLTERMRAFGGLFGKLFGGNRDLYDVFGYENQVSTAQMIFKYARQDLAARIIEAEPNATWSQPPALKGVSKGFETKWKKMVVGYNLMDKFARVDKLAGMARYAVLLCGYNDGAQMDQPVRRRGNLELTYIQPYTEENAQIVEWDNDPKSPRFGKPLIYQISPADVTSTTSGPSMTRRGSAQMVHKGFIVQPFRVHWTRIVHIAENVLEDEIFGYPRMARIYNLLDDLLKVVGGSSESYWLMANRGLQVDVDKDMDFKQGDAEALSDEIDEYMHNLTRVIRTKGVKVNSLGSDVADGRGSFQVIISLLSGATGIPQRILLGAEAGQLASAQDRANWANRIEERRNLFAQPSIIGSFIDRQMENGVLDKVEPENIEYDWPDAFRQNPLEQAQTNAQQARSLANVSKALSDDRPAVTLEEGRQIIGITDEVPAELTEASRIADEREAELHELQVNPPHPEPSDPDEDDDDGDVTEDEEGSEEEEKETQDGPDSD